MIITQTPLRISMGGGGTDLPSYYSKFGGFLISAAIDKYIYNSIHHAFGSHHLLKYSKVESVEKIQDIQHPIIREALKLHEVPQILEITSQADIPAGTGLGSSGAFTVGLLRGLYALKREHVPTHILAEEACRIEIDLLKEPVGKQDQYIAAFGGVICMEIDQSGIVNVTPLRISSQTLHDLNDHLMLFFTGYSRSASKVLLDQKERSEKNDQEMIDNLHIVKELGLAIKKALEEGQTLEFANLMHQHWLHKKQRSNGISNSQINHWYDLGYAHGAMGGKLIGAGGGGFLMFYARDKAALRAVMSREGLREVPFSFDFDGSKVLVNNN
jgi:D-glycero-alpha-D-manno-heptose-7-phosphate kinase